MKIEIYIFLLLNQTTSILIYMSAVPIISLFHSISLSLSLSLSLHTHTHTHNKQYIFGQICQCKKNLIIFTEKKNNPESRF